MLLDIVENFCNVKGKLQHAKLIEIAQQSISNATNVFDPKLKCPFMV